MRPIDRGQLQRRHSTIPSPLKAEGPQPCGSCDPPNHQHERTMPMAKKRIPSEHLRRKVLLLCEDANALADDIKHLAHTAQDEHQALLLAAKASEIAIIAISQDLWGSSGATTPATWSCPRPVDPGSWSAGRIKPSISVAWRASGRTYLRRTKCVHSGQQASGDECLWLTHERAKAAGH